MTTAEASETLDVTNLILTERSARDRSDWASMGTTYDADSFVHLSWFRGTGRKFVEESQRMHAEQAWQASHRLSPPLVTLGVGAQRALAEVGVAIDMRQQLDDVEVDITSYGRLLYRARRAPNGWLITHLTMIYERDTLIPVIPGAIPTLDLADLARHRASYRYLCYVVERSGEQPQTDLPGADRPQQVVHAYQSASAWLSADGAQ